MKEKVIWGIVGVIFALCIATGLTGVVVRVYGNEQMKKTSNTILIPASEVPATATPASEEDTKTQEETELLPEKEEPESELFEEMKFSEEDGNPGQVAMGQGTGQQVAGGQPQSTEVQSAAKPAQSQSAEVQPTAKPVQQQNAEVQWGETKPADNQAVGQQSSETQVVASQSAPAEPEIIVEEDNSVSGNYELPFVPAD